MKKKSRVIQRWRKKAQPTTTTLPQGGIPSSGSFDFSELVESHIEAESRESYDSSDSGGCAEASDSGGCDGGE
jgi:hypothetical protein